MTGLTQEARDKRRKKAEAFEAALEGPGRPAARSAVTKHAVRNHVRGGGVDHVFCMERIADPKSGVGNCATFYDSREDMERALQTLLEDNGADVSDWIAHGTEPEFELTQTVAGIVCKGVYSDDKHTSPFFPVRTSEHRAVLARDDGSPYGFTLKTMFGPIAKASLKSHIDPEVSLLGECVQSMAVLIPDVESAARTASMLARCTPALSPDVGPQRSWHPVDPGKVTMRVLEKDRCLEVSAKDPRGPSLLFFYDGSRAARYGGILVPLDPHGRGVDLGAIPPSLADAYDTVARASRQLKGRAIGLRAQSVAGVAMKCYVSNLPKDGTTAVSLPGPGGPPARQPSR